MTDTTVTERDPMTGRVYDNTSDRDRHLERVDERNGEMQTVKVRETRRSLLTTEFWITLAAAAGLVIAGYWDEADLSLDLAYALAAGIVAAYVLSRGFAKSGSGVPVIRNVR